VVRFAGSTSLMNGDSGMVVDKFGSRKVYDEVGFRVRDDGFNVICVLLPESETLA